MKDHRFIELLNLYIDRQITAEETAELEAEIQNDPKRQAVYKQYCQIHAATKLVYESFRAGAAEPATVPSGRPATVESFETPRRFKWVHYVGGFAAAAACVGLLLVRHQANPALEAPATIAQVQPAVVAPVQAAPVQLAAAPVAVAAAPARANLISLRNTSATPDYSAMLAAMREQDEERALAERWQTTRSQSLFDDNLFDAKHPLPASESRPAQNRTPSQAAEFTAFQFQR